MKKVISVLTILAFVTPAIAVTITVTAVDESSGVCRIDYATDANLPRAFALKISVDNGAVINSATNFNADYWFYPASIDVNATTGLVDNYGTPIVGTLPASSMIIAMSSFYDKNQDAPPAANGTLLKFTVNKSCNISLAEDITRGGVVMESPSEIPNVILNDSGMTLGCATCPGDLNGDGWKKIQDWFMLKGKLNQKKSQTGTYDIASGDSLYNPCADMNADGWVDLQDWFTLKGEINYCIQIYPSPCGQCP